MTSINLQFLINEKGAILHISKESWEHRREVLSEGGFSVCVPGPVTKQLGDFFDLSGPQFSYL